MTEYLEISKTCYVTDDKTFPCLHWARFKYDEPAELCWGTELLKKKALIEKKEMYDHFTKVNEGKTLSKGCPNPWNYLDDDAAKLVKTGRLEDNAPCVHKNPGYVNFNVTTDLTEEKMIKEMKEFIQADCWSVYTCDKNKTPIKVYFDSRKDHQMGKTNDELNNELRDKLCEDQTELLEELKKGNYVNIIMGYTNFIDVYIYYTKDCYHIAQVEYNFIDTPTNNTAEEELKEAIDKLIIKEHDDKLKPVVDVTDKK